MSLLDIETSVPTVLQSHPPLEAFIGIDEPNVGLGGPTIELGDAFCEGVTNFDFYHFPIDGGLIFSLFGR